MNRFRNTGPMNLLKSFCAVAIVGLAISYAYSQVGTSQQFLPGTCPLHQVSPRNCDGSIYAASADHSAEMGKRFIVDGGEMEKARWNSSPYGKWRVLSELTETELGL